MKTVFSFPKVAYNTSCHNNPVEVEVELRLKGGDEIFTIDPVTKKKTVVGETPTYVELSMCGTIWNHKRTDCYVAGQCLDTISKYLMETESYIVSRRRTSHEVEDCIDKCNLFLELYDYWKRFHLNGMHAGTPEQEAAIEKWKAAGNKYEYGAACKYLESIGLYEVEYTGLSVGRRYDHELYKYGHAWLIQELPAGVVSRIKKLIADNNARR